MIQSAIRRTQTKDLQELVELSQKTFIDTFIKDFSRPYQKEDLNFFFFAKQHSSKKYLEYMEKEKHAIYVLDLQNKIQGYCLLGPCSLPHPKVSKTCGELKRIYLNKKIQGKGYGKILLEQAFNYLRQNFKQQWIGVWSENFRAQKIYESYGFKKVSEYIYPVGNVMDKEFIYHKKDFEL